MRRFLTLTTAAAAAIVLAAPMAQASTTKYEFHDVQLSEEFQHPTTQASVKTMKKKPDNIYCRYQTSDWQPLGYYLEFVDDAAKYDVEEFCIDHFEDRWQ